MESAILILALLFVAFVALGVYATVKAVRVAKRGVERTVTQARRTVEDTTLRAKSFGQVGVAGELAQLRLKLRTSMRATQDALNAGVAEDASLSESISLFERLSVHGRELDDELRSLERDPDRATLSARLPELRERMERITHSAESLRWAARDRARQFAEDDLDVLSGQIDMEAGALRHWSDPAPQPGATSAEESRETSWPPAGDGRTVADQSWSDAETGATHSDTARQPGQPGEPRPEQQPQAITAPDPRQNSYPWQKSARPETTN
ncbi:hypothetical protein [Streptomyces albipurpureus]|uniref:Secreted protein n=1 Tax=Streptomyces albipurpureus TaxID=2897419 RepID=A0ABT0UIL2_9ACTN|nr:hypothetical protein [Streptomyces sp. CWNU-1]MCM2388483.1 hypothetical protein [Streptomyces sp. CWNU-1]